MRFPLEPPWSTLLDFIACFACGFIGARIERHRWSTKWQAWNEGEDDDFEPPESWFGLALVRWHLQYVRGYSRIRQALYCWRHKLVAVPSGSIMVENVFVATDGQLIEPVPADYFSTDAFSPRLSLPIAEPGMHVTLTFRNKSKFNLRVDTMALCRTGGNEGMMPLPFPSVDVAPEGTATTTALPVRPVSIERLLIAVPKHLPKPKH